MPHEEFLATYHMQPFQVRRGTSCRMGWCVCVCVCGSVGVCMDVLIDLPTNTRAHKHTKQMLDLGETEVEEELFNDFLQCVSLVLVALERWIDAGPLSDRLTQFNHTTHKTKTKRQGDLGAVQRQHLQPHVQQLQQLQQRHGRVPRGPGHPAAHLGAAAAGACVVYIRMLSSTVGSIWMWIERAEAPVLTRVRFTSTHRSSPPRWACSSAPCSSRCRAASRRRPCPASTSTRSRVRTCVRL